MPDILVDTNVLIYAFAGDPKYVKILNALDDREVGISVMTLMEILVGAGNEQEAGTIQSALESFEIIPVSFAIAQKCALSFRKRKLKSLRHPWFADAVIGQTALSLGIPLMTNNPKDFSMFAGLETIVPE